MHVLTLGHPIPQFWIHDVFALEVMSNPIDMAVAIQTVSDYNHDNSGIYTSIWISRQKCFQDDG